MVNVSMSNSEPAPPVNTRNSGPLAVPVSVVVTVWNVSQPPVTGTATEPSSVPVAEPDRIWIVPPAPAEEILAENARAPAVFPPEYPAPSPFSIYSNVNRPLAPACPADCTPDCDVKASPSTVDDDPPLVPNVTASTSNRLPWPVTHLNTWYSVVVPDGPAVRFAETFANVSQLPVGDTATEPSRVPVADPARTSTVPPGPADDTRAVIDVTLPSAYGLNEIQSPSSVKPTVWPPSAPACDAAWMHCCAPKCSA